MRLALLANDAKFDTPEIHSRYSCPELAKSIEPVGKAYALLQGKYMRRAQRAQIAKGEVLKDEEGNVINLEDSAGEESAGEEEKGDDGEDHKGDFGKKGHKKTKAEIEKEALDADYYKILEIEYTPDVDEKKITMAFRKMALTYHPDKLGKKANANTKKIWLTIQKAYDTLTDPAKKRKYDSSLPFDDSMPKESDLVSDETFYDLFEKCFANNAKFAVDKPVPHIGNKDTPMD